MLHKKTTLLLLLLLSCGFADLNQRLAEMAAKLEKGGAITEEIQSLLEETCPQEKRTALLRARTQESQIEMREKVKRGEPPFLSFVIPCYNREKSVRQTIESIYSQNLNVPFEVIAIDDASADRSFEVLQEYERLYDNFFAFRHAVNLGAPATRNRAVALARGAYICNADSDDLFEKGGVQPVLEAMISRGYDVAFFQELRFFIDFDRTPCKREICPVPEISLEAQIREHYISPCAGNCIYSKESWLNSGGYLEQPGHDTWAFSYELLATGYKGYIHPGSFYWHRIWSNKSSKWDKDFNNNEHDISPQKAVLDHPELLSSDAFIQIQLYKPNQDLFMTFLKNQSQGMILTQLAPLLLKARHQENKGEHTSALALYTEALQLQSDLPLFIYLRATRLALQLKQKQTALHLLQKAMKDEL